MAYLHRLREFRSVYAHLRNFRSWLPISCMLCSSRTPGGLCEHCRHAVCASRDSACARCIRCDLMLEADTSMVAGTGLLLQSTEHLECPGCRALRPGFDRVVAAFDYQWPGDLLIHRLKQQGQFSSAPILAELMAVRWGQVSAQAFTQYSGPQSGRTRPLITAIPASRRSLVQRGYNPAAEVGRMLARRLGLPWRPDLLTRVREGEHQKTLKRSERLEQVEHLYACTVPLTGHDVLVVDDVMTTGATLHSVALALKTQGACRVWGAVAARTPAR